MGCRDRQGGHAQGTARTGDRIVAAAAGCPAGAGFGVARHGAQYADEGSHRRRRGVESARAHPATQPLARGDARAPSPTAGRGQAIAVALHHPGQYAPAYLRAVRLETGRVGGFLPAVSGQRAAPRLRSAGNADPADAAQGWKSLRARLSVEKIAGVDDFAVALAFGQSELEEGLGDTLGRRQRHRVFAGKDTGAQSRAYDPRSDQIGAHSGLLDLRGIGLYQHLEPGFAHRIGAPIGARGASDAAGDKDRAPVRGGAQQRVHRPNQPPIGGEIKVDDLVPQLGIDMPKRRERAELGCIADEDVEVPVTLVDRRGELVDLDEVAQVERHQRGAAAGGANLVVDLFETTWGARRQDQVRSLAGEALGDGGADTARSAGDKGDLAGELPRHYAGEGASFGRVLRAARRWTPHSAMP